MTNTDSVLSQRFFLGRRPFDADAILAAMDNPLPPVPEFTPYADFNALRDAHMAEIKAGEPGEHTHLYRMAGHFALEHLIYGVDPALTVWIQLIDHIAATRIGRGNSIGNGLQFNDVYAKWNWGTWADFGKLVWQSGSRQLRYNHPRSYDMTGEQLEMIYFGPNPDPIAAAQERADLHTIYTKGSGTFRGVAFPSTDAFDEWAANTMECARHITSVILDNFVGPANWTAADQEPLLSAWRETGGHFREVIAKLLTLDVIARPTDQPLMQTGVAVKAIELAGVHPAKEEGYANRWCDGLLFNYTSPKGGPMDAAGRDSSSFRQNLHGFLSQVQYRPGEERRAKAALNDAGMLDDGLKRYLSRQAPAAALTLYGQTALFSNPCANVGGAVPTEPRPPAEIKPAIIVFSNAGQASAAHFGWPNDPDYRPSSRADYVPLTDSMTINSQLPREKERFDNKQLLYVVTKNRSTNRSHFATEDDVLYGKPQSMASPSDGLGIISRDLKQAGAFGAGVADCVVIGSDSLTKACAGGRTINLQGRVQFLSARRVKEITPWLDQRGLDLCMVLLAFADKTATLPGVAPVGPLLDVVREMGVKRVIIEGAGADSHDDEAMLHDGPGHDPFGGVLDDQDRMVAEIAASRFYREDEADVIFLESFGRTLTPHDGSEHGLAFVLRLMGLDVDGGRVIGSLDWGDLEGGAPKPIDGVPMEGVVAAFFQHAHPGLNDDDASARYLEAGGIQVAKGLFVDEPDVVDPRDDRIAELEGEVKASRDVLAKVRDLVEEHLAGF